MDEKQVIVSRYSNAQQYKGVAVWLPSWKIYDEFNMAPKEPG